MAARAGYCLVLCAISWMYFRCAALGQYLMPVPQVVARLVFSASRYDHITPLLRQLHWLKAPKRVEFKLAILVYKCRQRTAPSYLFEELCQPADFEARRRLRSASSSSLVVRLTRLSTIGDRAFPVAAARIWNGLLLHVTSAPSLPVFAVVWRRTSSDAAFRDSIFCFLSCLWSDLS